MDHQPFPDLLEMPAQKSDGKIKFESGGGAARNISGGENSVLQRHSKEEINPDVDPCLRVMERLREFFCKSNRDGISCQKGSYGREV